MYFNKVLLLLLLLLLLFAYFEKVSNVTSLFIAMVLLLRK